jgi:hypothetical protein
MAGVVRAITSYVRPEVAESTAPKLFNVSKAPPLTDMDNLVRPLLAALGILAVDARDKHPSTQFKLLHCTDLHTKLLLVGVPLQSLPCRVERSRALLNMRDLVGSLGVAR